MSIELPRRGDRVRCLAMPDERYPVTPGTEGTVLSANEMQIFVNWDSERRLALVPGVDDWVTLTEAAGP